MKEIPMDCPVFKIFYYKDNYFLYDTYTNSIFKILKSHFEELYLLQNIGISNYVNLNKSTKEYNDVLHLINKGMLKFGFIKKVEHPETCNIKFLLDRCVNDITLQVTRDCNFKCRYCLYANDSKTERNHEDINMCWETAKKTIDFLYQHSIDVDTVNISFYGGEPLLNFDLIVKTVNYASEKLQTKKVHYNMTINGSLLTDNIINFLILHNFDISISLDGPQKIQNNHRKFLRTGGDTYDTVIKKINSIRRLSESYFMQHVYFLPVYLNDENYQEVYDFFEKIGVMKDKVTPIKANLGGMDYILSEWKIHNLNKKKNGLIKGYTENEISKINKIINNKNLLPPCWHHNGQCIPGVQRVFIDVYGIMYPCEKITENKSFSIGNIQEGFDVERIIKFLNVGKLTATECKKCWAMRFCEGCISLCNDIDLCDITRDRKLVSCEKQKEKALYDIKSFIDRTSKL
ncbi:MAG: radical SAM protein [Ruminococcaceae bacterium]|nr:radical SAM protein [Oscillospiraceae bacterium]